MNPPYMQESAVVDYLNNHLILAAALVVLVLKIIIVSSVSGRAKGLRAGAEVPQEVVYACMAVMLREAIDSTAPLMRSYKDVKSAIIGFCIMMIVMALSAALLNWMARAQDAIMDIASKYWAALIKAADRDDHDEMLKPFVIFAVSCCFCGVWLLAQACLALGILEYTSLHL